MAADDPGAPITFGILLYVNRSGSTLLSRLLSESGGDLFVFPEVGFPVTLLLERRLGRARAGGELLAAIRADPRRDALPLADARLAEICAASTSARLEALLTRIAIACHGARPAAVVLKLESLLYVAAELRAAFRRLAFFHLVRDPRAVASSMLRARVPETPQVTMARGSVWYAAAHWRGYVRAVDALAARTPVTELRYEALLREPGVITGVRAGLGLAERADGAAAARYRIGAIDAALHARVFDPVEPARGGAWRGELDAPSARVVALLCAREMARRGYDPGPPPARADRALLRRARVAHLRAMARHGARAARGYLRRGGAGALLRRLLLAAPAGRA